MTVQSLSWAGIANSHFDNEDTWFPLFFPYAPGFIFVNREFYSLVQSLRSFEDSLALNNLNLSLSAIILPDHYLTPCKSIMKAHLRLLLITSFIMKINHLVSDLFCFWSFSHHKLSILLHCDIFNLSVKGFLWYRTLWESKYVCWPLALACVFGLWFSGYDHLLSFLKAPCHSALLVQHCWGSLWDIILLDCHLKFVTLKLGQPGWERLTKGEQIETE